MKAAPIERRSARGLRIAIVREFMVKHTKNDEAISDQLDRFGHWAFVGDRVEFHQSLDEPGQHASER